MDLSESEDGNEADEGEVVVIKDDKDKPKMSQRIDMDLEGGSDSDDEVVMVNEITYI